ncbi:hypothetical protein GCM10018784_44460 [Streptomyces hydrogenans]|nr:hypothetical protein GCM10018784_44460 [Streptomyces hydrogenans]
MTGGGPFVPSGGRRGHTVSRTRAGKGSGRAGAGAPGEPGTPAPGGGAEIAAEEDASAFGVGAEGAGPGGQEAALAARIAGGTLSKTSS